MIVIAVIFGMILYAVNWIATCGIIYLASCYFDIPFNGTYATVIWMGIIIVHQIGHWLKDLIIYFGRDEKNE